MLRTTRIELFKESFKFSSGHFTVFSETERENIHGHNFTVHVALDAVVEHNGMVFDYVLAKQHIETMCEELNECFLLPAHSKFLTIDEREDYTYVNFNHETIPFLRRDIKILPVENIAIEDLAWYFLQEFVRGFVEKNEYRIFFVDVRIFSGPGQSANAVWKRES